MGSEDPLIRTEQAHTRPQPRRLATARWARTGTIPPGEAAAVAAYRARITQFHENSDSEGQGRE